MSKNIGIGISPGFCRCQQGEEEEIHQLLFNGTSTRVTANGANLDDLQYDAFTVDAWINLTAFNDANHRPTIIASLGVTGTHGWEFAIYNDVYTLKGLSAHVECAMITAQSDEGVLDTFPGTGWHHVTMYYNNDGDRKIYLAIDGNWLQSYGHQGESWDIAYSDSGFDKEIGRRRGISTDFTFNGSIGWVRISNNDRFGVGVDFTVPPRTTIPATDANTMGLWPLNEGEGTIANDVSSNNYDGTITDGEWE